MLREIAVHPFDQPLLEALPRRRLVERLHLDEELVDHSGAGRPHERRHCPSRRSARHLQRTGRQRPGRHRQSASVAADGVDLLDEPDRSPFTAGCLTEGLEEGPDLDVRHPVPHGLEGRRGDEQERDARLFGHGLGQEGLSGPGRAFEQDAPPGIAAQDLPERRVAQEHVERADHLVDLWGQPNHIGQANLDVFGPDQDVGRPAACQWHQHHQAEQQDQQHRWEPDAPPGG